MPITFACLHCGKEIKASQAAAGKRGKCPYCGLQNDVPAATASPHTPAVVPAAPPVVVQAAPGADFDLDIPLAEGESSHAMDDEIAAALAGAGGQPAASPASAPIAPEDDIPLADIDEEEDRRIADKRRALLAAQRDLLAESGAQPGEPLEQKEDLRAEDLYHFVVNYCLDMLNGRLERAATQVAQMRKFKYMGQAAVQDFITGRATEDVLKSIQPKILKGFLMQLAAEMQRP